MGLDDCNCREVQILATSDLHGKFFPWDYALNEEDMAGSVVQLKTLIDQVRTDCSLLVDAGDTIQDNAAEIFLDEDVHPMVAATNALGYDVVVTGNHEYNYGMDVLCNMIKKEKAHVLVANVYHPDGRPLAEKSSVFIRGGIRIGVIGVVTPNIMRWDRTNLSGWTVTDPVDEIREQIALLKDRTDVLIAVCHMSTENEYGVPHSGVDDIANACPELSLIVAAHKHERISDRKINGVNIVENDFWARTLADVRILMKKTGSGWMVDSVHAESLLNAGTKPDPVLYKTLLPFHEKAINDACTIVGALEGGSLTPAKVPGVPAAQLMPTPLIDLINRVQMHYAGAEVSGAALFNMDAGLEPGQIRKCDVSLIYRFTNTLYRLKMTGWQLRKYMEWSAAYFQTWKPGDLTLCCDPDIKAYNYDMFLGVSYELNVSREKGHRIENLCWPDGRIVEDSDQFIIAVNNYRACTQLLVPGEIYAEDEELPELLEKEVCGNIGGIRELIREYIIHVSDGVLHPDCAENWRITGIDWNNKRHEKAMQYLQEGKLQVPMSPDKRTPAVECITEERLREAEAIAEGV